jgi:hypothetical protein
MAIAYYPSLSDADTVELGFIDQSGSLRTLRLLVDSGFTGQSSFVLSESSSDLAHALVSAAQVSGAIQGIQKRVVVSCHIEAFSFQYAAIAILSDLSNLSLPVGVDGLAGLRFLRRFRRWGAEQLAEGGWRFFLETDTP